MGVVKTCGVHQVAILASLEHRITRSIARPEPPKQVLDRRAYLFLAVNERRVIIGAADQHVAEWMPRHIPNGALVRIVHASQFLLRPK